VCADRGASRSRRAGRASTPAPPGRPSAAKPRARPSAPRAGPRSSWPQTDELDLGLQAHAESAHDLGLGPLDEPRDVGGARAALVDDEVAVQLGDHGLALARALESRGLDQPPRRIARRVLEHAAAVL